MQNLESFRYILPELVLAGFAVLMFGLSAATRGKQNSLQRVWIPLLSVIALLAALFFGLSSTELTSVIFSSRESTSPPAASNLFFGLLTFDPLGVFFRMLVMIATLVAVLISIGSPDLPKDRTGEYHGLLLILALGMCFFVASNHLLMLYVSMETVSLCSYLLTGWNTPSNRSREAGLKYVLYGGVASGIMLFGMSLLYGLLGHLSIPELHSAFANSELIQTDTGRWACIVSVMFILAGLGYKIAAVPFHMWSPDAYEGAPTPFTALLSVAPKAAGMAVILRFFHSIFVPSSDSITTLSSGLDQIPWVLFIGILSALSMTVGNLIALAQNNLKRLLAYSSIAHAGYVLMAVASGGRPGFEAVTLYMVVYLFMNMGAFAVVSVIDRHLGTEEIHGYKGLSKRAPLVCFVMAIFLFSLTGLPPTAGFIGKYYLFAALFQKGGTWFMVLALIGVLNSVISLFYYARIVKAMYLDKTTEQSSEMIPVANLATVVAALLAVPTLILGIFWDPLARLADWSASILR